MHRDRGDAITGAADRLDTLFAEVVTHEIIADEHKLRRHKPDLIAAPQEHGVLGSEPQATVDGDEPIVRADLDAGHGAGDRREHRLGPLTQPLVLRPPRYIAVEARHVERRDAIARLETLDRHGLARGQPHRRPGQHAVGTRPGATRAGTTRPASPRARPSRPRTARAGASGTRAARAATAATGPASARRATP